MATSMGGRTIAQTARELRQLAGRLALVNERHAQEPTELEERARLRQVHAALGREMDKGDVEALRRKWAGKDFRALKRAEHVEAVAELGPAEYDRRVADAYRR